MKKLDLYIAKSVLIGIIAALFIITAIDWLGDLFYQVGKMSADDHFSHVVIYTLLDIPHKLLEFLPSSLLIGALLSLGQLASSSELIASGASGCSRLRVATVSCVVGMAIVIGVGVVVELYGPASDRIAAKFKQDQQAEGVLLASDESYWVRDRERFVRIGSAISNDYLRNITIYSFDEQGAIAWIGRADAAIRKDQQWNLSNFHRSFFSEQQVTMEQSVNITWQDLFLASFLQSMTADPFKLPLRRLTEYISYLDDNHLDAIAYRIALFKRIALPFTGLAMLLLALPLVFRPRQLGGIGQRLFAGIVIALLAYVIIEAITNGAVVYRMSPVLAAFLPTAAIMALAAIMFRFTR